MERTPVSPNVDVTVNINPFEVVQGMNRVYRRKLTPHQLAELVTNSPLNSEELQAVQTVVKAINRHTEMRFTSYNSGLQDGCCKKTRT